MRTYSEDVVLEAMRQCIEQWETDSDPEDNVAMLAKASETLGRVAMEHGEASGGPMSGAQAQAAIAHIIGRAHEVADKSDYHVAVIIASSGLDEVHTAVGSGPVQLAVISAGLAHSLAKMLAAGGDIEVGEDDGETD